MDCHFCRHRQQPCPVFAQPEVEVLKNLTPPSVWYTPQQLGAQFGYSTKQIVRLAREPSNAILYTEIERRLFILICTFVRFMKKRKEEWEGIPMSPEEKITARARLAHDTAFILYEGKRTPHRSCGICLAETFNLPTRPYQSLRKGGITGKGECGSIKAGELILGEYLGDPDPTGVVTDALRTAAQRYRDLWHERLNLGSAPNHICENLTAQFGEFTSPERVHFCTNLAADVAAIVAQVLTEAGVEFEIKDIRRELGLTDHPTS
jgi:hypothetical protein